MNLYDQLLSRFGDGIEVPVEDHLRMQGICSRIRGYSDARHYAFFKTLMSLPIQDVLILGVYQGRDIAFMHDCCGGSVKIVGVDKFSDDACADWPQSARGKRWSDAGFGEPPSVTVAAANLGCVFDSPFRAFNADRSICLIQAQDDQFLVEETRKYDVVYIDTSHDYETVVRQCQQVRDVCKEDAIICGDDYSDQSNAPGGSWGVKRAVSESFTDHIVFADWIWASSLSLLRQPATA